MLESWVWDVGVAVKSKGGKGKSIVRGSYYVLHSLCFSFSFSLKKDIASELRVLWKLERKFHLKKIKDGKLPFGLNNLIDPPEK